MIRRRMVFVLAAALSMSLLAGCAKTDETTVEATETSTSETTTESTSASSSEETSSSESEEVTFELSSEDLKDGVWDNVISNTSAGENKSPELKWEAVEGAKQYVIYMVDPDGGNWLHWKSEGVTETSLPRGWASDKEYVGPYPPSGSTHTYDVYVVALKAPAEKVRGIFDSGNPKFNEYIKALDTDANGNSGNIISYGYLSGTFTSP